MKNLITAYIILVTLDKKYWMVQDKSSKTPKDKYYIEDDIWTNSYIEFEII